MLVKVDNKVRLWIKIVLILSIFTIILFQFSKILSDFDINTFYIYRDKLSLIRLSLSAILGIISYLPLSLYDFIIKDTCKISLDNKSLYKSAWIASSISSIVGFGGTAAIALKSYFYSPYIKDKAVLVKEISKMVLLNFTGFSTICFIYSISNIRSFNKFEFINIGILLAGLYAPVLILFNLIRLRNYRKRESAIKTIKVMMLSICEWLQWQCYYF